MFRRTASRLASRCGALAVSGYQTPLPPDETFGGADKPHNLVDGWKGGQAIDWRTGRVERPTPCFE